jgi:hypothetical protein
VPGKATQRRPVFEIDLARIRKDHSMQKTQSKYGDYIEKETIRVFMQTSTQKITGMLHIVPNIRLKDNLNRNDENFLVVTEARVSGIEKEFDYILVQRDKIIWLSPLEDGMTGF